LERMPEEVEEDMERLFGDALPFHPTQASLRRKAILDEIRVIHSDITSSRRPFDETHSTDTSSLEQRRPGERSSDRRRAPPKCLAFESPSIPVPFFLFPDRTPAAAKTSARRYSTTRAW
jgi:hypothetical protein